MRETRERESEWKALKEGPPSAKLSKAGERREKEGGERALQGVTSSYNLKHKEIISPVVKLSIDEITKTPRICRANTGMRK